MTAHRLVISGVLAAAVLAVFEPRAAAQTDPLIALKRVPPNVIVVFDTSFPMLSDGQGNVYDIRTYKTADDPEVASALGVRTETYRRIYRGLQFETTETPDAKYHATDIVAVPSDASTYANFWAPTRFATAKAGLLQAVTENPNLVRWGLLKLRQDGAAWRDASGADCDKPVRVTDDAALVGHADVSPCAAGAPGELNRYDLYAPSTTGANGSVTPGPADAILYGIGSATATAKIQTALQHVVGAGPLIPAGAGASAYADRPLYNALIDARAEAVRAIAADDAATRTCRNTVVVLIASGKDDGDPAYLGHDSTAAVAGTFATVAAGTGARRVPIVVIGVNPETADESSLQTIAAASGGRYFRAGNAGDVTAAVDYAVEMGFSMPADVDAVRESEYTFVSSVVGTVNLAGASDAAGAPLSNTDITATAGPTAGARLPQPGNFLLTSGFGLPGFDGRLRAFRTFTPVPDAAAATGWNFVKDGTRLWPNLDDRPDLSGLARTPLSPDVRNIYTYVPDGFGGGAVLPFTVANGNALSAYLGGADPAVLIPFVRAQPIGALIGSTPAIIGPPSLNPAPDQDYGSPDTAASFAGAHKTRRPLIVVGANDGMIHAFDARTGYEVWAFIPYNVLPKLRTLLDGQPVERFDYFVDSSPKVADVKFGGAWKTVLVVGEGYGGTFYQAFDVTEAGMGVDPAADGPSAVSAMLIRFSSPNQGIRFIWAFPNYSSFDPSITYVNGALTDGFPGNQVAMFGDLKSTASNVEKRVGFTFSDPAIGALATDRSVNAVITGSGYFPDIESDLPGRGVSAPKAGHAIFLLDAATGTPIGDAGGTSCSGTGCVDVGDAGNGRKNALQADVTAGTGAGSNVITQAYAGDVDGTFWRVTVTSSGAMTATPLVDTGQPIYGSSALLSVGTTDRYLFFGTGSDLLSNVAPAGGSSAGTAFKLYGIKDGPAGGAVVFTQTLARVVSSAGSLITNGERPTSAPSVAGDIVFFTTTTDGSAASCGDASTKLYAFTYQGSAAYDTNGDGTLDANESPVVATTVGRGTAPSVVDRHLYVGVTSTLGAGVALFGDPSDFNNSAGPTGIRILSWREIR